VKRTSKDQQPGVLLLPPKVASGQKFGKLTVIDRTSNDASGRIRLRCKCDCSKECVARLSDLRSGHTKSCGCRRVTAIGHRLGKLQFRRFGTLGVLGKTKEVHETRPSTEWVTFCDLCGVMVVATSSQLRSGKRRCPCLKETYGSWRNMIQRCENKNHGQYHDYGGRGIYVCEEWRSSFQQFVRDMGRRPLGKTLDRRDPNGPYSRANGRWSNAETQAQNRRKATAKI
jgi:hypothetical protein